MLRGQETWIKIWKSTDSGRTLESGRCFGGRPIYDLSIPRLDAG